VSDVEEEEEDQEGSEGVQSRYRKSLFKDSE
jgi:hypothetical protein